MLRYRWRQTLNPFLHELSRSRMATTTTTTPPQKITFGPYEVTSQVFLTTPHSFALVNLKPLLPGHVLVCPLRPHARLTDLSPAEVTDLFTTVQRVQGMLARHYFSSSSSSSSSPHPPNSPPPSTSTPSATPSTPSSAVAQQQQQQKGSFNIALQDGPEAGQTVPHVHVHVIPRVRGVSSKPDDGTHGDELYEQMAGEAGNVGGALWDHHQQQQEQQQKQQQQRRQRRRPTPGGKFDRIEDSARQARSMREMEEEAALFRGVLREMEGAA